jgi:hypothetical protein
MEGVNGGTARANERYPLIAVSLAAVAFRRKKRQSSCEIRRACPPSGPATAHFSRNAYFALAIHEEI